MGGAVATSSTGHAQPEQAEGLVRVVHGLRGLVADVYLDGTLVLPTFRPERATDPLPIPAGDHLVEIRQAGAAATDEPLLTQEMTVPAGFPGSVVAHLDANGNAKLTAFADDLSAVPAGQSRVVVRHAAEAGPGERAVERAGHVPTAWRVTPRPAELVGAGAVRGRGDAGARRSTARRAGAGPVRRRDGQLHVPHRLRRPTARSGGPRCGWGTWRRRRPGSRPVTAAPRKPPGAAASRSACSS